MKIVLDRLRDNGDSTIGTISIDDTFSCFTLEDTFNEPKIMGKTRIPEGEYAIKLRPDSPMATRYSDRYNFHKGMLWLQDVPNFKWVYIHVGNKEDDTDGCILVGRNCMTSPEQMVAGSVLAYSDIYEKIADTILSGEKVTIKIV